MPAFWYPSAPFNAFGSGSSGSAPNIDYLSDDIYVMLLTSSYTPSLDHDFLDDVVANEISGTGYTANGALLSGKALNRTAANAWSATWAGSTAYTLNTVVRPTTGNGFVYRVAVAGTSGGSEPTWPTVIGQTVTDGGVTWSCAGRYVVAFVASDPSWTSATFTARYAVIYDRTPASNATRPLLAYIDFDEGTVSVTNSTFSIDLAATGALLMTI